jgi:protein-S-isoprenylcysteine O-methyltransferase Ste14
MTASILMTINASLRMAFEEAELRHRFGTDYQAYVQRVGAFLPRLGRSSIME